MTTTETTTESAATEQPASTNPFAPTPEDLRAIIEKHRKWWNSETGGQGAYLQGAYLQGADLRGAKNLDQAKGLDAFKSDILAILIHVPHEIDGLLTSLRGGRINGRVYKGECACLVGTIANTRGCNYHKIPGIMPNESRPAEVWFYNIKIGDTPETSAVAKLAEEWIVEWKSVIESLVRPERVHG